MNKFDKLYEEEMKYISEGAFKSMATAGLVGLGSLGVLGAASKGDTDSNQPETHQRVQRVSDTTILTRTLPHTKRFEGYRDAVYTDTTGNPTIGYGSNLNSRHIAKEFEKLGYSISKLKNGSQRVRESDAEHVLVVGLVQALADSKKFVNNYDELEPTAKIVLLDMSYNLGLSSLSKFKKFKSALEAEDYKTARDEMIKSKWYSDVGRRSKYLVNMMDALADRS